MEKRTYASPRRPAWLAGDSERTRSLERQAREIVLRFTAARADRFRLVADAETDPTYEGL